MMSLSDASDDDLSSILSPDPDGIWERNDVNPRDAFQRSGHVALGLENELLIWGGTRCSPQHHPYNDYCDPNVLWIYNTLNDVYTRREILGVPPPGSCGSAAVIHDGSLYIFGGFKRDALSDISEYSNHLHRVDLTSDVLTWKVIVPKGECPLPCDKLAGFVHDDKLYFFGGFGRRVPRFIDVSWVQDDPTDRGWNNQFVCYNTKTNSWEWPRTSGPKPLPRAAHSAAVSGDIAYIFGGRLKAVRNDELHSINLKTMTWSGDLKTSMRGHQWPCGRSWHSFTFTSPTVAFIQGGMSNADGTLNDVWKLTFEGDAIECEQQPTDIIEGGEASPSLWHQSVYFPKGNEIISVGGLKQLNGHDVPASSTIILVRTKHARRVRIRTNPLPDKRFGPPKPKPFWPTSDRLVHSTTTTTSQRHENAKPEDVFDNFGRLMHRTNPVPDKRGPPKPKPFWPTSDRLVHSTTTTASQRLENAKPEDVFDNFGRLVAAKLRSLPNNQRIFAEKLTNDVLFEAQLGNLSRQSYLCPGTSSMPEFKKNQF